MKKLSIVLFLFIIGCASINTSIGNMGGDSAFSPNFDLLRNYRLAVLPATSGIPIEVSTFSSLYDFVSFELLKTGRFSLIERQAIDAILREQEFGVSGIADPSTAAELGKVLGADAVLLTQVNQIKRDEFFKDEEAYDAVVFVRLVDSSTGEILYYGKGFGSNMDGKLGAILNAVSNAIKPLKEKGDTE